MAFWGVEVKPSTPVVHSCEKANGRRLRISQATLGIGGPTERNVVVQCKVGNRIPVLLCALIPQKTESCHLELEFEEADDVVFSVIGPRSVYLTGYYVCKVQLPNPQSDSESHGVDIENSHTQESSLGSDNDKYEESFINDSELEVLSQSPVPSSNEDDDEDTPVNDNLKSKKGRGLSGKWLRKKRQIVESDDNDDSCESEDWNMAMFKSKKAASKISTRNTPQATVENGVKLENDDIVAKNGETERTKTRKKRKERSEEEKSGEDKKQEIDASTNMKNGDCKRSKKRKKELSLEGMFTEDNKSEPDLLLHDDNTMSDMPAENKDQEQQTDNESVANASQPEKKTKKKKNKKIQIEDDAGSGFPNATDSQENNRILKSGNQTASEKSISKKTLSNGMVIEEVVNGPPDGKVAAPGKKVKIYYTAMLKENDHVFDSNVGKSAHKFRLGDEGNIDGWNLGIDGMHVGDKRRLIIPPSMGFGKHGSGENVPPNSWIVYDIELVGVRK
ncbi:hypothetical protein CASFOL_041259 [Castilleja foliolosa]|uniref:peptidylprolyl isomerase n=1 Tax=Castilleja foliolosa TaxID=1961234 RepID=A0ABD3BDY7_9LAMI